MLVFLRLLSPVRFYVQISCQNFLGWGKQKLSAQVFFITYFILLSVVRSLKTQLFYDKTDNFTYRTKPYLIAGAMV
ncbi:hypothetical protein B9T24_07500 [Acinetobacter sp. ANC 4654]|nr:hypothetical protein B9T24_07500 [Acinetobacter sp. ANC 4654]